MPCARQSLVAYSTYTVAVHPKHARLVRHLGKSVSTANVLRMNSATFSQKHTHFNALALQSVNAPVATISCHPAVVQWLSEVGFTGYPLLLSSSAITAVQRGFASSPDPSMYKKSMLIQFNSACTRSSFTNTRAQNQATFAPKTPRVTQIEIHSPESRLPCRGRHVQYTRTATPCCSQGPIRPENSLIKLQLCGIVSASLQLPQQQLHYGQKA